MAKARKKAGATDHAPEMVTIRVLSRHLEQIVLQLQAVILAAKQIAERPADPTEFARRPPNFLIGAGCQVSIDAARDLLKKNPNR